MTAPQPTRTVSPEVAKIYLNLISSGDLSFEESMRQLFPEDAVAYDLDNNLWGQPRSGK
jgi:hypothetical protein